ncbi:HIT family protein [Amycolatopsis antarctica]|uniref:HIT family protein n=1 Tax=Amycolatopsis antarctica TaxID=1854586 RepID=A0A263D727_9PSEU|nr:HIT family protein [Amycolatopsis antarctica]OZM74324.1 HIT family protein [Amycolatopsis antarctica]
MASTMGCYTCGRNARFDSLPPRERVAADEHWRAAHAFDTALPGWLVLAPRRHVTTIANLSSGEAAALGGWQVRLSRALREVTGCAKTYVVQFAEQPGYAHVHFHLVPVAAELPPERRGPGIFALLGAAPADRVGEARMDELAISLQDVLR